MAIISVENRKYGTNFRKIKWNIQRICQTASLTLWNFSPSIHMLFLIREVSAIRSTETERAALGTRS